MRYMRLYKLILALVICLLLTKPLIAESSKEYAIMAKSVWSAFECSVLAEKINNSNEQERLFIFGYKQGLKFIDALNSGRIKDEDLSAEVPIMMILHLQGPTPDFMLGRVFEGAADSALNNVYRIGETLNSDEEQQAIAKKEFWIRNCALVGK